MYLRLIRILVAFAAVPLVMSCKRSDTAPITAPVTSDAASQEAVPAAPPEPSDFDLIASRGTLAEAIAFARPHMAEAVDQQSKGTLLLGYWGATKLTWAELDALPATRLALVKKDPDEHRGQRFCGRGVIVEIQAEKVEEGVKVFHGALYLGGDNDILRFVAVGSTGELVGRSYARFCGVVTGKFDYHNSVGGMAHAVAIVGMFDLPENHRRTGM